MTRTWPVLFALVILFVGPTASTAAELRGVSLFDAQLGNIPFRDPDDRQTLYGKLDLDLRHRILTAEARVEFDRNSDGDFDYTELTRRTLTVDAPAFRIKLGHVTTILGRGLVHRSFELTGVVLDQPAFRSRYTPSRDLDGGLIEGQAGALSFQAFIARPNSGEISPGVEHVLGERYSDTFFGTEIAVDLPGASRLGMTFASAEASDFNDLASIFVELDPAHLLDLEAVSMPLYFETARGGGREGMRLADLFELDTSDEEPHAVYALAQVLWGSAALSAEWKDYALFRTGINDPPSLVREQPWQLLNRGTHVLDAALEQGFQIEGVYAFEGWGSVTANLSRSDGRLGSIPARFEEHYVEVYVAPDALPEVEAAVFYDSGKDTFAGLADREAFGLNIVGRLNAITSLDLDWERQLARRGSVFVEIFNENLFGISVSRAGWGTLSLLWENTSDPAEEDPDKALEPPIERRHFLSAVLGIQLGRNHETRLFVGERRGGRACTAGTCYEVLPFKGAELQVISRF